MRIIAGKHKGRILAEFKGKEIRPTADRAKEAIFNILQGRIVGCNFLDLFSGTGSVGIEALSRGAKSVTLVDISKDSLAVTFENLKKIGENAKVVLSDAKSFVKTAQDAFDIIFLDPPYKFDATEIIEEIGNGEILKKDGLLIHEHDETFMSDVQSLELFDARRYGIAIFDFYKRKV